MFPAQQSLPLQNGFEDMNGRRLYVYINRKSASFPFFFEGAIAPSCGSTGPETGQQSPVDVRRRNSSKLMAIVGRASRS
jgi:hypothetical protein